MGKSFTEFVDVVARVSWRAAWRLTGDPVLADDLLQTALAKTWPDYEKVARTARTRAYVRRNLSRPYASWWQRKRRGEVPLDRNAA